jgi:hypothetical protein
MEQDCAEVVAASAYWLSLQPEWAHQLYVTGVAVDCALERSLMHAGVSRLCCGCVVILRLRHKMRKHP